MSAFDPFEAIFGASDDVGPSAELKQRLRVQTSRVLRRRALLRRVSWAGAGVAAAGLLAAGLTLPGWWPGRGLAPRSATQDKVADAPKVPVLPEKIVEAPAAPIAPLAFEWNAFDSTGPERSTQYVAAGNLYLEKNRDFESALRCYREALDKADPATVEIVPSDTWLLMALKMERRKER